MLSAEAGDRVGKMKLGTTYLVDVALKWFAKSLETGYKPARVYIDQLKARKLESQLLPEDINTETKPEPELELTELK